MSRSAVSGEHWAIAAHLPDCQMQVYSPPFMR
jgi:hypothetical protein